MTGIKPLDAVIDADNAPRVVQVRVLGAFAMVACLLAGLGLRGLLSFSVSARTREIGLRMALGLRRSALLTGIGLAAGGGLAVFAGTSLRPMLAGLNPFDGAAFAVAGVLAGLSASAGTILPSVRAMRVDPLVAIRHE